MESPSDIVGTLFDSVDAYSKTTFELVKLKSMEKTANLVAPWIFRLIVFILLLAFGILFSIGIALWLGDMLGTLYYGFFIVAGFYLFSGIVVRIVLYQRILNLVTHSIYSNFLQ